MNNTLLAPAIQGCLSGSSMIPRMFEAGIELKNKYGADKVYDFSLGNPDLPPPRAVQQALRQIAEESNRPFALGYMPNAGYPSTREALARLVTREQGIDFPASHVVVTVGAAGGLNAFFRAVLTIGDEVLVPSPYFVEYGFYCGNYGGKLVPVPTNPADFSLDLDAIRAAITPKTRAIIINTPNNPTGQIYPEADLRALAQILDEASKKNGRIIYLVSDEPYRALNYESAPIPSIFSACRNAVVIGSFSKTLSLPGERIGYVAVNPAIEDAQTLVSGIIFTNRTLGYVNAPAIGQKIIEAAIDARVDVDIYHRRRDALAKILSDAGIEFFLPKGAFYIFAKSPVPDEKVFVQALLDEQILVVPGSGFGLGGHVRLAFCVEDSVIENSAESFRRAMTKFR